MLLRTFGVTLAALSMLALATSACALPQFLPITGGNKAFKGKLASAKMVWEDSAGTKIECTAAPSGGGFETDTLGTFHMEVSNCSAGGAECKNAVDKKAGVVLFEGSFHFVYDVLGAKDEQEGGSLGVALLFLLHEVEFECAFGLLKNKFKGTLLCLIRSPLTSATLHAYNCEGKEKGVANEKTYYNDGGTSVNTQWLVNFNEGGFKEADVRAEGTIETAEAGAFMTE